MFVTDSITFCLWLTQIDARRHHLKSRGWPGEECLSALGGSSLLGNFIAVVNEGSQFHKLFGSCRALYYRCGSSIIFTVS